MNTMTVGRQVVVTLIVVSTWAIIGCGDPAGSMMRYMDARPPDEQIPEWPRVRALMSRPAPEVGTPAPRFALQTLDSSRSIDLSTFHTGQPKVLIFGSYT